jgi:hypothetical protein
MSNVNSVEQPGSDVEIYVDAMEKIYNLQLEKINFMKMRLVNFKKLLKEEREISNKFMKYKEVMAMNSTGMYDPSFQNQSEFFNNEIGNLEDNCEDEEFEMN